MCNSVIKKKYLWETQKFHNFGIELSKHKRPLFYLLCNIFTAFSPAQHLLILVSVVELTLANSLTPHTSASSENSKSHSFFTHFESGVDKSSSVCPRGRLLPCVESNERTRYIIWPLEVPRGAQTPRLWQKCRFCKLEDSGWWPLGVLSFECIKGDWD